MSIARSVALRCVKSYHVGNLETKVTVVIKDGIDGRTNGLDAAGNDATFTSGCVAATTKSNVLFACAVKKKFHAATAAPLRLPCFDGIVNCVADS